MIEVSNPQARRTSTRLKGQPAIFEFHKPESRPLSMNKAAVRKREKWAKMTPEEKAEANRKAEEYRKNNRERTRAWNNKYREKYADRERVRRRGYKTQNRERINELSRVENYRRAKKHKAHFIEQFGSKCSACGYLFDGDNAAAFDFHHLNPELKDSNVAMGNSLEKLTKDLEGCVLLCSNCHRIFHEKERRAKYEH